MIFAFLSMALFLFASVFSFFFPYFVRSFSHFAHTMFSRLRTFRTPDTHTTFRGYLSHWFTHSHVSMCSQSTCKTHSRIETLIFWLSWNLQRICFPTRKTSDHPSLWTYFKCNDYYLWMWVSVWFCATWKKNLYGKTISNEFFHDFTEHNTRTASATSHRMYKLNVKNACSNNSSIIYIQIQRNKTK